MLPTASWSATVQAGEVEQRLQADEPLIILDVRTAAEFESVHIPGSHNLPLDQLAEARSALSRGVAGPVVLVCRSGARARQAELLLREAELDDLHVLDGGLMAWESAGLAVSRGRARWSIERQVRAIAGGLILVGTLGSVFVWPPLLGVAIFVGAGLLFAGLTDFCGMGLMLMQLPLNRGPMVDVDRTLQRLVGDRPRPASPAKMSPER